MNEKLKRGSEEHVTAMYVDCLGQGKTADCR